MLPRCPSQSSSRRFCAAFRQYKLSTSQIRCNPRLQCLSPRGISTSPSRLEITTIPPNHYALFPQTLPAGPPPAGPFEVDLALLKKEFLQLQSRAHPDLHQGTSKVHAEEQSALINDAYKTLQNPLLRAEYILSLRGIQLADDEGMQSGDKLDQEVLMDVLKVREAIEEAETEEEVKALERENAARIRKCVGQLEDSFARDALQGARKELGRLRYWCTIEETLKGWETGKEVDLWR